MTDVDPGNANRYLVLGFPRSGTTLLSRLLDSHPKVSSPPETGLFSAAGRFLAEQTSVEGPPIGVITGLAFSGLDQEDVLKPLRDMIFAHHARIAGGKPVWVEKTGTDVFHVEVIEPLIAGHMKIINLIRHPLDVIASNLDLMATMGAQLPELFALTRCVNCPVEGLAQAWANRIEALDGFVERHRADCHTVRYEDFLGNPASELSKLFAFLGVEADVESVMTTAFAGSSRIGLGDFRIHETAGLRPPVKDGWRKRLPRAAASRVLPLLAPLMERHCYTVPKLPKPPSREDAIRQFTMAAMMKRSAGAAS